MRILIANHIDDFLLWQADQRTFTQRVFWFAADHDVLILAAEPDPVFVEHVTRTNGVDARTLRIHVTPQGRFERKMFDPQTLLDEAFLQEVAAGLDRDAVTEVFPLWPSPPIAAFAERLGLSDRLPGAGFTAQGGGELANSKATFRALAAAHGIPIADGEVCRTIADAEVALQRLLATGPVMVKQVQNCAGVGNELLFGDTAVASDHAGARHQRQVLGAEGVRSYLEERWEWASVGGRFPVVFERFVPGCRTIFAEFVADDGGVRHAATGALIYKKRRLVAESTPLRDVASNVLAELVQRGQQLAEVYRGLGYRGYMSADAVVDESGALIFTEMNARVGGSPHIYEGIGERVVGVFRSPERSVVQFLTPPTWKVESLEDFLRATRELGCAYDPKTRKGVLIGIPPLTGVSGGAFLFCVAYDEIAEPGRILESLDARFS